jgi:hypothetical protein
VIAYSWGGADFVSESRMVVRKVDLGIVLRNGRPISLLTSDREERQSAGDDNDPVDWHRSPFVMFAGSFGYLVLTFLDGSNPERKGQKPRQKFLVLA